ncbi:MAG TPA: DNA-formamidopyrimidine glycosylase family protein [Polyangia bacterium]|jgi:formamidopyrimidine-DNA glycosylase|nr:DNA-formamidopyrimidine glycosylase family protein [Polyangia bacterium]
MPELPDLAHVESVLRPALGGRRVVGARTGDPLVLRVMVTEPFPALLIGRTFTDVSRRGHFMRFALDNDLVLVVNAMLVGRYRLLPPVAAGGGDGNGRKRDPRALGLAVTLDDDVELQYVDDKRMGKVYVVRAADEKQIPVYGKLGLDVLSPAFTREAFGRLFSKRRDQARMFLMDKSALASIGNAYADEILFAARIHPKTFCNKLSPADADALYAAIPSVLRAAVDEIARRAEPIDVKVRDFLKVRGRDGKPCPNCGTTLRAVRVGDGDACFCPSCQPTGRKLFVDFRGLVRGEAPTTAPGSAAQPVTPARRKKST